MVSVDIGIHFVMLALLAIGRGKGQSDKSSKRSYTPYGPGGGGGGYPPMDYYPHGQMPQPPIKQPIPGYSNYYPIKEENTVPNCRKNNTEKFCFEDLDYPKYEIGEALSKFPNIKSFPSDAFTIDTGKSVDTVSKSTDELYLCPTKVEYQTPLRGEDVYGKWQIIVNVDGYTQMIRTETCGTAGQPCPLVPVICVQTNCVQKNVYMRLIVLNPYHYHDHHQSPFAIAIFKIPSACSCHVKQ